MKRVLIALVILLMVSGLCWFSLHTQVSNVESLLEMTDRMEDSFDPDNPDAALELSRQFVEEFRERTRSFPFFMRHADIWSIEETVAALPIYLETGDTQHFPAELAKCRSQLEKLYEVELPLPENIL